MNSGKRRKISQKREAARQIKRKRHKTRLLLHRYSRGEATRYEVLETLNIDYFQLLVLLKERQISRPRVSENIAEQMSDEMNKIFEKINGTLEQRAKNSTREYNQPSDKHHQMLLDFSTGKIKYQKLVEELNIRSDEELLLMMILEGLPMPSLPGEQTQKMVEDFEKVLRKCGK